MANNLIISVITPSYNQAKFIRKTLDSVLCKQDYDNIEYIVVDGCSSDGTLNILNEYNKKHSDKFSFIYEKDSGQSNALNKGFKKATGDIIGWVNSDDYYEDNVFRFVVAYFQSNPDIDMIYGGCNRVNADGVFLDKFENGYGFKKCRINDFKIFNYNTLLNVYSGLIPQQSVFFRKQVFSKVGYLDESYHFTMDYEYWLRIGKRCKIQRVDKVLANFRTHSAAKTNLKNRFDFIKESSKARRKYGGHFIAPFYFYNGLIICKTLLRIMFLRLGLLKG